MPMTFLRRTSSFFVEVNAVLEAQTQLIDPKAPWQEQARCRGVDGDVFFPERGESSRPAKRICAECPVRLECLNAALRRGEQYGVWGGMTQRERRRLLRTIRRQVA